MKKVSLATIANQLNVSTVTVHKALKNQSGVSDALKKRILDLADELGYVRPNASAPTQNFVYIINKDFLLSVNEQYYTRIFYHLSHECSKTGASLHLVVHESVSATMASVHGLTQESPLSGIFVAGQIDTRLLDEIAKLNKPVVCIDFFSSDYPFNYVYVDNYYAGYTLTKYLIKRGHKKICFIGDIKFSNSIADRYFGYLRALNKYDLLGETRHINQNIERSFQSPDIELSPDATAYICHCDRAAATLYSVIEQSGKKIPDDVSVIGFDNTDICQVISPKLSSLGISKEVFAIQALNIMQQAIQKKRPGGINYIKLNLTLYERDSVADGGETGTENKHESTPKNTPESAQNNNL